MEIDLTTALGRLLRDSAMRAAFSRDPVALATALKIRADDSEALVALSPNEIEDQAQTLLQKRFHEVRKLVPVTFERLGARAWECFVQYATGYWPAGHQRHQLDAIAFCERVAANGNAELNRLRFILGRRRFDIHIITERNTSERPRRVLQLLKRSRNGASRERVVSLRL